MSAHCSGDLLFVWPTAKTAEFPWQQPRRQPFVCRQLDEKLHQTTGFCFVGKSAPNQLIRILGFQQPTSMTSLLTDCIRQKRLLCQKGFPSQTYESNKIMSLFRVRCRVGCDAGCMLRACERHTTDERKMVQRKRIYLFIWMYALGGIHMQHVTYVFCARNLCTAKRRLEISSNLFRGTDDGVSVHVAIFELRKRSSVWYMKWTRRGNPYPVQIIYPGKSLWCAIDLNWHKCELVVR